MQYALKSADKRPTEILSEAFYILRGELRTQALAVSVPRWFTEKMYSAISYEIPGHFNDGKVEHYAGQVGQVRVYDNKNINYIAGITTDYTFNIMFGFKTVVMNVHKNETPTVKFI